MLRLLTYLGILALVVAATLDRSVADALNDEPVEAPEARVVCEVTYANSSWGYQHKGVFVDERGAVYRYEYNRDDKPFFSNADETYSETQLHEKYDHRRKWIGTVSATDLRDMTKLVGLASAGELPVGQTSNRDAGTYMYACYAFEITTKTYRRILLRVDGNRVAERQSEAARQLIAQLDQLARLLP